MAKKARKRKLTTRFQALPNERKDFKRGYDKPRNPQPIDINTAPGTLGSYFYSFPQEIRDDIFACLLVRPPRWDVEHRQSCELRKKNPEYPLQPYLCPEDDGTCANAYQTLATWRHRILPTTVDPFRSVWAPPQTNPYLCTYCWDWRYRPRPFPITYSLPCLCARREHLQTLLVCRRWYEEAGRVFYSRNTFSFTNVPEGINFFDNLNPRWKPFLTKICLLNFLGGCEQQGPLDEFKDIRIPTRGKNGLAKLWRQLRSLPFLSELELDAIFLTRLECVEVFRGPPLKNLRQLKFTQSDPNAPDDEAHRFVWPRRALRWTNDDNFSACITKWIMGSRYGWVKGLKHIISDSNTRGVRKQRSLYTNRIKTRLKSSSLSPTEREKSLLTMEDDGEYDQLP
ncbi:uncharacterized protein F4807DRAFT_458275 [Annulohypoxylon truncatum]|uniref:uncharacterized protein n=1 Tax=Annulohypoxylon truncatum TaxID=327061 RepID=UPI0020078350|nr:uncharacterized protein F4807DRAFT_458275 [Annulohypoxylon truncatum]KAI1212074.1 hypothetical protein F4807DRAFT_458275 [Annulohypoxylon truncatum]